VAVIDDKPDSVVAVNLSANQDLEIHPRPEMSTEYVAPTDSIEEAVCTVMAELLGIEKVGMNDNFFELGGHSLLAVQAVSHIRKRYDVQIPMRALLFEDPTAMGIASIIKANNQPAESDLESLSDADVDVLENLLDQIDEPV